jgi:acyl carrier protein phosphodiesterase
MNYLAHIFLAGPQQEAQLGAILGDFIKGSPEARFSTVIAAEIAMHRAIDVYTDSHEVVRGAKLAFAVERGRYAGILLDVFYDHLLSVRWPVYSALPRDQFIRDFYDGLTAQRHLCPPNFQYIADRMIAQDWLGGYRQFAGVKHAVDRISVRLTNNGDRLRECWTDLERNYDVLAASFDRFFPQLLAFVENQRATSRART